MRFAAAIISTLAIGASAFIPMPAQPLRQQRYQPTVSSRTAAFRPAAPFRLARVVMKLGEDEKVVLIGVAADSGCGKSTFMRRLTNIFGGQNVGPLGGGFGNGGWETNTLVSDTTTVICLDDYHANDRQGRKVTGRTALHSAEQKFDLMFEQLKALKAGKAVEKPIYNHVNGTLDRPELIKPTPIVIVEGLHPWFDSRVRDLLDFTIYLDISDEVKRGWKIQRDMAERGWSLEQIEAEIEKRKPDFNQYVAPQREVADAVIQVLPTQLTSDDTGKYLRVRLIQKEGSADPVYLFDQGSTISWIPCGKKLTCAYPGIKFASGPDQWFNQEVDVVEMDGEFANLEELAYVEKYLGNTGSKFSGEITQQLIKNKKAPGSLNGSGLFQTIVSLKIRQVYEKLTGKTVQADKALAGAA